MIDNSGLSLSPLEVHQILQREVKKLATNIDAALKEADHFKRIALDLHTYDVQLSRWYSSQRQYVKQHSPTIMAALLLHPSPITEAIEKAKDLHLALHPKPHQPFPDVEAARHELSAYRAKQSVGDDGDGDLGSEALQAAAEAIASCPERRAFLVKMNETAKQLRETIRRRASDSEPVKTASTERPDPVAATSSETVGQTPPGSETVGQTPPGSETVGQTPPIEASAGSQESVQQPPAGPADALPADPAGSSSSDQL